MEKNFIKYKPDFKIKVEVFIVKEDDYFVAYCPALEISGYGDTEKSAKESFDREMIIFIEETKKRGTLEKYLLQKGWRLRQEPAVKYEPPKRDKKRFPLQSIKTEISIPVY